MADRFCRSGHIGTMWQGLTMRERKNAGREKNAREKYNALEMG